MHMTTLGQVNNSIKTSRQVSVNANSCSAMFLTNSSSNTSPNVQTFPQEDSWNVEELKANELRNQIQARETTQRKVNVYHFTYHHSGLKPIDDEEIMYMNVPFSKAKRALPSIFTQSFEPARLFGRTLIVCSFGSKPCATDCTDMVSQAVAKFHESHPHLSLYNITIYNEVGYPGAFMVKHINKCAVRKVINVISHDNLFASDYKMAARNLGEIVYDTAETLNMCILPLSERSSDGASLRGQWWYKLFKKVPLCADGRLIQTEGTCWWNAAANLMILTDPIVALLKMTWNTLPAKFKECVEKIELDTCPFRNVTPVDFMYVLINQIVIHGKRALDKSINFSSDGAALFHAVKIGKDNSAKGELYQNTKRADGAAYAYKLLKLDGGSSLHALSVFLQSLLQMGIDYNFMYYPEEPLGKDWTVFYSEDERFLIKPNWLSAWRKFPYPQFVIIDTIFAPPRKLPLGINVNGHWYVLEAAGLNMISPGESTPNHAVAGLTCHNASKTTRYIFDSNNITSLIDWSTLVKGEHNQNNAIMTDYTDSFPEGEPVSKFVSFRFLVYVFQALT